MPRKRRCRYTSGRGPFPRNSLRVERYMRFSRFSRAARRAAERRWFHVPKVFSTWPHGGKPSSERRALRFALRATVNACSRSRFCPAGAWAVMHPEGFLCKAAAGFLVATWLLRVLPRWREGIAFSNGSEMPVVVVCTTWDGTAVVHMHGQLSQVQTDRQRLPHTDPQTETDRHTDRQRQTERGEIDR